LLPSAIESNIIRFHLGLVAKGVIVMEPSPRTRILLSAAVALVVAGQACNLGGAPAAEPTTAAVSTLPVESTVAPAVPPTETPLPPTPTVVHLVRPGSVPPEQYFISDVSSGGADEIQRAQAGDNYNRNRLERPFDAPAMTYRPDLDLGRVEIGADDTWFYFTLVLYGSAPGGVLEGPYGIELDLDGDGSGDLLLQGGPLTAGDWTTDTVRLWRDGNDDVGGMRPMESDAPLSGADGYETPIFDAGVGDDPDAAWVRPAQIEDSGVQFAVKRSILGDESFLWGAWADAGISQPAWLDYNDRFTETEAGSLETALGAVAAVDNTCRMYFGFTPTGSEPGLCVVTGTVRNCSPHPMRMEPGGKMLTPFFDSGAILKNVQIGTYRFHDESTGGTLVLTATLSPGGTITITKTGLGDTYPCQ
jgi:hypothetical protein